VVYDFLQSGNVDAFPWTNRDGAHAVVYHIIVNKCMGFKAVPLPGM
jgi:hypothetical protein